MKIDRELHTRADLDTLVTELIAARGSLPGIGDVNPIAEIGRFVERLLTGPPSMGSGPGGGSAAELELERRWYTHMAMDWRMLAMLIETDKQARMLNLIGAAWRLVPYLLTRPLRTTYACESALTGALMPGEASPCDGGPVGRSL